MLKLLVTAAALVGSSALTKWLDNAGFSQAALAFVWVTCGLVIAVSSIGPARLRQWGARRRRMGIVVAFFVCGALGAFGWYAFTAPPAIGSSDAQPAQPGEPKLVTPPGASQLPPSATPTSEPVEPALQQPKKEQTEVTKKDVEQSSTGPNSPNVIIQPGGAASFGQQGGITAGSVNLLADEKIIRSLSIRLYVDYETKPTDPTQRTVDLGWSTVVALFDTDKQRYRFVGRNFEFENYQLASTVHRLGFHNIPEDGNDLIGSPIHRLARIDVAAFNLADFFSKIRPENPADNAQCKVTLVVNLNGFDIIKHEAGGVLSAVLAGQVNSDVKEGFRGIEAAYAAAFAERFKR